MLLANDVANFFVKKIDNIHSQITSMKIKASDIALVPPALMVDEGKTFCSFRCLTEPDVRVIITKSAKPYKLDPLPTSLHVNCLDELLPVITAEVNLPLKEGYFPSEWKNTLVKPLLKKTGLSMDHKNLRPVSNLQFVSKVKETAAFDQLHKHLEGNDFYPVLQSAYRKQESTIFRHFGCTSYLQRRASRISTRTTVFEHFSQ